MSEIAGSLSYVLEDFADEIMPCDGTLNGWAQWLSKPDPEWRRSEPESDGAVFKAYVQRAGEDIIARRVAGAWEFSRDPLPTEFLAVRWGNGLGWSADNIIWGDNMAEALRDWFVENDRDCEDIEYVATATDEPEVMLTYRADPPSLSVETRQ